MKWKFDDRPGERIVCSMETKRAGTVWGFIFVNSYFKTPDAKRLTQDYLAMVTVSHKRHFKNLSDAKPWVEKTIKKYASEN